MTPPDPSAWRLEPPDAYVRDTGTAKGRGVFARRDFAAGELVEECPVILLTFPFAALPPELQKVVFNWGALAGSEDADAVVLGYGSMYNHDNPANLRYEADPRTLTMRFVAVRQVRAGEELTINYNAIGGGAAWGDDNWFARVNVQPIVNS